MNDPQPPTTAHTGPDLSERDFLVAENVRLAALLAEQRQLRGSRLIRALSSLLQSQPVRWLNGVFSGWGTAKGGPVGWSWASMSGPDLVGTCEPSGDSTFFAMVTAQRPEAVTVIPPAWRGVRSSAENLFDARLYIDRISESDAAGLARKLADANCSRVVLHGLPLTYERIVEALRRHSPKTRLYVIWHGNLMQLGESAEWLGLQSVLAWARDGVVERVGFVKQGMAEVFAQRGIATGFIKNFVKQIPDGPSLAMDNGPHLGLWAVEPIWRKLPYTMIAAASLVPNAQLWAAGQNRRAEAVAKLVGVPYHPLARGPVPQAEMPKQLARLHLNLYVTLSECAPMLPLESLAVGVPCLTGPTSHLFEDNAFLHQHLVVAYPDQPRKLANSIALALEQRETIVEAYRSYAPMYAEQAKRALIEFLS